MSRTLGALHPHKVLRLSLVLWRFWLANPDLVTGAGMDSFHSCLVVSSIIFNWMCDVTWRTSLCSSSAGRVHTVHIWLWPIIQSRPFPATKPIMRWLVGGRAAGTTNGDSSDHILPHTLPLACPAAGQRLVIIISVCCSYHRKDRPTTCLGGQKEDADRTESSATVGVVCGVLRHDR